MISPFSATRTAPLNCPRSNRVDISLSISVARSGAAAWASAHHVSRAVSRRVAVHRKAFDQTVIEWFHMALVIQGTQITFIKFVRATQDLIQRTTHLPAISPESLANRKLSSEDTTKSWHGYSETDITELLEWCA